MYSACRVDEQAAGRLVLAAGLPESRRCLRIGSLVAIGGSPAAYSGSPSQYSANNRRPNGWSLRRFQTSLAVIERLRPRAVFGFASLFSVEAGFSSAEFYEAVSLSVAFQAGSALPPFSIA